MFIIPEFSTQTLKEATTLNSLLSLVDTKLANIGKRVWAFYSFGEDFCGWDEAMDLLVYRDIIIQKINGCACYKCVSIQQLTHKIKTLTK